jgi:Glycosyltransferase family 87
MQNKRRYPLNGCLHPAILPLALFLGYYLIRSASAPWSDFAGYYFGGRELLSGHGANAYDMEKLNSLILQAGYRDVFVSYAPFPPFTSLVFAPVLLLPMGSAKLLFGGVSCVLFLVTLMRARVFFDIRPLMMLTLPVVFYIPMLNNLFFGQSYLLLSCLLLEGFMAYKRGRIFWSSLWWGVAILFKVFPGVVLIWLLLRKKFRMAAGLCAACVVLLGLSLFINGWAVWKYYVLEILPKVGNGELNNSFTFIFQSAFMLLKRLFVYDTLLNPSPFTDSPFLFGILMGLFKALILSVCVGCTLRKKDRDFDSFAVWIAGSMLISPNGSSYSLVLLVIPLLSLMTRSRWPVAPVLLLAAVCFFPVYKLDNAPVWEQFPRLYLLLLFFALLLWPLRLAWHTGIWAGLSLFFIVLFLAGYHRDTDRSTYFFDKEEHIFINDYSVSHGVLVYSYRDQAGVQTVSTGMGIMQYEELEIRNKQIYYKGKQLTSSPDSKKKPLLINGVYILYLSDKNRGPGFYTLRRLGLTEGI